MLIELIFRNNRSCDHVAERLIDIIHFQWRCVLCVFKYRRNKMIEWINHKSKSKFHFESHNWPDPVSTFQHRTSAHDVKIGFKCFRSFNLFIFINSVKCRPYMKYSYSGSILFFFGSLVRCKQFFHFLLVIICYDYRLFISWYIACRFVRNALIQVILQDVEHRDWLINLWSVRSLNNDQWPVFYVCISESQ